MKLTRNECFRDGSFRGSTWVGILLFAMALTGFANSQAISTTTVEGTVYLANGQAGSGELVVSWPAFTTASSQAIAAGQTTVTIAPDGFLSVSLAPNMGATPAGLYYTAVYYMSDGSTNTEYWVVPVAAQASLGQVRSQVMPAAQAVQAVNKAYVDQSIAEASSMLVSAGGGTLNGPLYLSGDPTETLQAADKHYVDSSFAKAVPLAGGAMTGQISTPAVNGVESPATGSAQTTLQAAVNVAGTNGSVLIPPTYAGTDTFTNPNGVYVQDLRQGAAQQYERSVKEFGAVCDGVTDDTQALQSAINYAQTHGVALSIPQGSCKTQTLAWHGESIGGVSKQVSALIGFPGQDVLAAEPDAANMLSYTRLHDLTIYVDQSVDVSCAPSKGRAAAGSCALNRPLESNTVFSPGGNGLTQTAGSGAGWSAGNCAIAMPAITGAGGNGLQEALVENLEIAATGTDPLAQYAGAHSTHTCGMYLGQWPRWSEFRNIEVRGLNTGIAMPALPGTTPAGLNADSNHWQNIRLQATHGFVAAAGSNNVVDDLVAMAGNSSATSEPPTGLVLDLSGSQNGWTIRNAVVLPSWTPVPPQLTVSASGGAVTGVTVGSEHGLGFDPYGMTVPVSFSGACTAQAAAAVNSDGSIGVVTVSQAGTGCSGTTTAKLSVAGTWDTAAPVNLVGGQNISLFGGNLLKGNGGYTIWNATGSQSYGTQLAGGGGSLPGGGGSYAALITNSALGNTVAVDQLPGADLGAKLQACVNQLSATNGGTCDARNFAGTQAMGSNVTIATGNVAVLLPCATISTASELVVTAGTRNVALRGCALRGTSAASGSQGGTVFLYSGSGAMIQVGDPTYATDTLGFHLDNVAINTTSSTSGSAEALKVFRTQELDLESLYLLGNSNQTGITLDGTGNYTGGTFLDNHVSGFQTAVNAVGHQVANPATTDWVNASTFVRLHIDCPTSNGSPITGTTGINLAQGDGNTFTGGDVENCATALHLGTNAQNNTIVGLRNENSTNQVVADAGSAYNNWMTGGTMFTGKLTDSGTRNSFLDTFHRSFNGMNGDWYGSQQDATLTNHYRLGIGSGNERGLLDRYQTDNGYRWTMGLSDATGGEQFYQVLDELNNVYRLSIGQYNSGQSSTNNQTVINSAGSGAVVLNGSNNSGTGGVVFGSGGPSETTVATIGNTGNAQFNGTLQVNGVSTFGATPTVKNQADAEIDTTLWAGLTTSQKESVIYKDWNGNSQWYLVKDSSNNWAVNSAAGGLDSFKAYQSTNSGDTYVNASNSSGHIRMNYEAGSGNETDIYSNGALDAAFLGTTSIKFPGLAAASGHSCLQIDSSGYLTNTGSACGSGTGGSGTVNSGLTGQIAYYAANGTTVGGTSVIPVTAGGTGSSTASAALASLGGVASTGGTMAGPLNTSSDQPTGHQAASANAAVTGLSVLAFGATADTKPNTASTSVSATLTAASNVLTQSSGTSFPFSLADVGKTLVCGYWSAQPFATTPSVAKITGFTDPLHVTLNQTAAHSTNCTIWWGTDNTPAFDACSAAAQAQGGGTCQVPAGMYLLGSAPNYVVTGAHDDGSYGTPAGGSGAAITASIQNGSISGYTVTNGGSGYAPNAQLQLTFSGGCGAQSFSTGSCGWAWATANTNSAGQVASVNSIYPGYGMLSVPAVTVVALGGDGAAATATIAGGAINNVTVTKGGAGYPANSSVPVYGIGGAGCGTLMQANTPGSIAVKAQGFGSTNASGVVTSVTMTNAGSGCTAAPTLVFGSYTCGGAQCANVAPLNPIALPTQIMTATNVNWKGVASGNNGASMLVSTWDGVSADNNEAAVFGGVIGYGDIEGLTFFHYFVGIQSNWVAFSNVDNLTFLQGGLGMWTAVSDLGSAFANLTFYGDGSWVNGGTWTQRANSTTALGGFLNATGGISHVISSLPPYTAYGPGAGNIDNWFATNIWGTPYSANSTFYETCAQPQAANQRQTDVAVAPGLQVADTVCYRGVTGSGFINLPRGGAIGGANRIFSLSFKGGFRYAFYGDLGGNVVDEVGNEATSSLASDPYRRATNREGMIVAANGGLVNGAYFDGRGATTQWFWGVNNPNLYSAGYPTASWTNSMGFNFASTPSYLAPLQRNFGNYQADSFQVGFPGATASSGGGLYAVPGGLALYGADNATDVLNATTSGVAINEPLSAPSIVDSGLTQGTSPVCPNGPGGALTTSGCVAGSGTVSSGTTNQIAVYGANGTTVGGSTALPNGTTATTQSTADTSTQVATDAFVHNVMQSANSLSPNVPFWLQNYGIGTDGANTSASGSMQGEKYYTNFTVPYGNTVTVGPLGLVIHATGTCTIAGTITGVGQAPTGGYGICGGASGGAGGGSSAGSAGLSSTINLETMLVATTYGGASTVNYGVCGWGAGGASSGGNGGTAPGACNDIYRACSNSGAGTDGLWMQGAAGKQGANSGGAAGAGGGGLVLICGTITGTDGTHTGTIDLSGQHGSPAAANSTGAGSGAGGGAAILASQQAVTTWPNVYVAPGAGGLCAVPEAVGEGGTCTQEPKLTLGVSGGALSGTATVTQAGAGCGTGAGVNWKILGGGGTAGTAAINPTWNGSGGVSSATVTAGSSSGFTATTYTTCGSGGDGGSGFYSEYANGTQVH